MMSKLKKQHLSSNKLYPEDAYRFEIKSWQFDTISSKSNVLIKKVWMLNLVVYALE